MKATTILGIIVEGKAVMGCDGQVSLEDRILKRGARKVQKIYDGKILTGFAGAVADAVALFERFEGRLEEFNGNLKRAAVELTKEWRTDRYLRRLEALLAVMDRNSSFIISGQGDVIEPDDKIIALGSGGAYALSAARAYIESSNLDPVTIVKKSLQIAASIDVYTNSEIIVEELK